MSIQTVDLKASKAFRIWDALRSQLIADPSKVSFFPKGHRDAVISDHLSSAISRMIVFRRSHERYYARCELRRQILHFLSHETGLQELLQWELPRDLDLARIHLRVRWNERIEVVEEPNA